MPKGRSPRRRKGARLLAMTRARRERGEDQRFYSHAKLPRAQIFLGVILLMDESCNAEREIATPLERRPAARDDTGVGENEED